MGKLVMVSVLLSAAIVPAVCASDPDPRRGLRRAVVGVGAFNAIYGALLFLMFSGG